MYSRFHAFFFVTALFLSGEMLQGAVDPYEVLPSRPAPAKLERKVDPTNPTAVVFVARDAAGSVLGYAVPGRSANGYGGVLELLVGLTPDRRVVTYRTTLCKETKGIGARIASPAFVKRFAGQPTAPGLRLTKDGGAIEALTGATISSRAVCEAIASARRRLDRMEGVATPEEPPPPAPVPAVQPLFDLNQDEVLRKVVPAAVSFTRISAPGDEFPRAVGRNAAGQTVGYAGVGTGRATGPQGELILHVLFGFRANRTPAMKQVVLNPPANLADMETAQRTAYSQALRAAMDKVRSLPRK